MASTPITELDFFDIKDALKTFLSDQAKFKDYDFEGSNMNVLLDILAYNTYYNNFYTNMTFAEMFLDSAQLRESIVSHAKELNYLPRSVKSASAIVQVKLKNVSDFPSFVTIPKYTKFTGSANNVSYTFTTDRSHTITPDGEVYCLDGVTIQEGKIVTESYKVTGDPTQRFIISNENVDIDSIYVSVRDTEASGASKTEYMRKSNLFGVISDDKIFYIQPYDSTKYELTFGKDVFGAQPIAGNIVDITYRISSKSAPNGISSFTCGTIGGYSCTITTQTKAGGGADRETNESIRFFAPKSIQIQDRAITESDYEILLKTQYPEIQAISVYGGEELNPPQYGRVIISVDVNNADGVSEGNKEKYRNFLKDRCSIAIEPVIVSPEFYYIGIDTTVYFNTRKTDISEAQIKDTVKTAILSFSNTYLEDFKKTFRYSKFVKAIDDADTSIVSNNTNTKAIIRITPELNTTTKYDLRYRNALKVGPTLIAGDSLVGHIPAIKSSTFTFNGTKCFLQDNGLGQLDIIQSQNNVLVFVSKNVGSVNYDNGRVIINNLKVSDFNGSGIKIYANPLINDIKAPKERIMAINENDINITVIGLRE